MTTQLTWDAVEVTPHTTAAPAVSYAYSSPVAAPQEVAAITTGDTSAIYGAVFLMPSYVKVVQTPTAPVDPVTEGIIFPRGVPTFCS